MKFFKILFFLGVLILLSVAVYIYSLTQPLKTEDPPQVFVINRGEPFLITCRKLETGGFIKSALVLRFMAEYQNVSGKIKAGEYNISASYSPQTILDIFLKGPLPGKGVLYTIPEGAALRDIYRIFSGKIPAGDFSDIQIDTITDSDIFTGCLLPEGFLFPDSYYFSDTPKAREVVKKCLDNFVRHIPENYSEICGAMKKSLYEIVIMASIVQAEAAKEEEMPVIASVFYNRLRKGMHLESCATVQYALPKRKERLTYDDLKYDSPFNTYLNKGLPPAPICNPGAAALNAAFFPQNTEYLYFVAKGDGFHYFSRTLSEHNRAKNKYIH